MTTNTDGTISSHSYVRPSLGESDGIREYFVFNICSLSFEDDSWVSVNLFRIADTWVQLYFDIFVNTRARCIICNNENAGSFRNDLVDK